jgi:hypothetical protein
MARYTYEILGLGGADGSKLGGQAQMIAKVLDYELAPSGPISNRLLEGMIRMAADASGVGKYLDLDSVKSDLMSSGVVARREE